MQQHPHNRLEKKLINVQTCWGKVTSVFYQYHTQPERSGARVEICVLWKWWSDWWLLMGIALSTRRRYIRCSDSVQIIEIFASIYFCLACCSLITIDTRSCGQKCCSVFIVLQQHRVMSIVVCSFWCIGLIFLSQILCIHIAQVSASSVSQCIAGEYLLQYLSII